MAKAHELKRYRDKRDFARSPEPSGRRRHREHTRPIFVIQKHDALHFHYDSRLQIGRVLQSWTIPKGPPTDPRVKRLAVETEDHPFDHADFEEIIPAEEYDGGTVLVWDAGPYRDLRNDRGTNAAAAMREAWKDGHIAVWLGGKKLRGGYSLRRFRIERAKAPWLLIKMDDEEAGRPRNPVNTEPESVLIGKIIAENEREVRRERPT